MNQTYIIAEIGPNHNGSYNIALELTEKLADIGVDAVKFQLGNAKKSLSLDAFKADYQKENDNAKDVFEASKKRQLTHEEHKKIASKCNELGVDYLCTAFDLDSLIFLNEEIHISKFKIASGEIFSIDMLEYMVKQNKPIILSTGMATFEEIEKVYQLISSKNSDITILHCVTSYPAPLDAVNLRVLRKLQEKFKTDVGYSDHTLGNTTAIASVAMGATVVEKHVTLDKSLPGPDHKASATIEEFADLVIKIRELESALGDEVKVFSSTEMDIAKVARKSIVAKHIIKKGFKITEEDLCFRRPGTGFLPIEKDYVIGKTAVEDIQENRVIKNHQIL
jgi:N,N'-diacetyllegionaminate synthase